MEWRVDVFGKGGTAVYDGNRRVCLIKSIEDADHIVKCVNAVWNIGRRDSDASWWAFQEFRSGDDREKLRAAFVLGFKKGVEVNPGWRCFHCDEFFTNEEKARTHFGTSAFDVPLCLADRNELIAARRDRDYLRAKLDQLQGASA